MSGNNERRIIPVGQPAALSEEKYKLCHRAITANGVIIQDTGSQMIGGQPKSQVAAITAQSPCLGPRCRMWDDEHEECSEVYSARYHVARLGALEECLSALNMRLGDIYDVIQPPSSGRPPLEVELVNLQNTPALNELVVMIRKLGEMIELK